jgi:hypothetical protein
MAGTTRAAAGTSVLLVEEFPSSLVSQPAVIVEIHDLREGITNYLRLYIFIFTYFSCLHPISLYINLHCV